MTYGAEPTIPKFSPWFGKQIGLIVLLNSTGDDSFNKAMSLLKFLLGPT
jgi:hypothetical protein